VLIETGASNQAMPSASDSFLISCMADAIIIANIYCQYRFD
jgi:hypothetical protein